MFSRKWKFEGSCTKKLDQKWKFAEMEIWVRIFCKRGRNGIPFYREWTVGMDQGGLGRCRNRQPKQRGSHQF